MDGPRPGEVGRACVRLIKPGARMSLGKEHDWRSFFASQGVYCFLRGRCRVEYHHEDRRTPWEKSCLAFRSHWMDLSLTKMMTSHSSSHGWEAQWNSSMKLWAMRWARPAR